MNAPSPFDIPKSIHFDRMTFFFVFQAIPKFGLVYHKYCQNDRWCLFIDILWNHSSWWRLHDSVNACLLFVENQNTHTFFSRFRIILCVLVCHWYYRVVFTQCQHSTVENSNRTRIVSNAVSGGGEYRTICRFVIYFVWRTVYELKVEKKKCSKLLLLLRARLWNSAVSGFTCRLIPDSEWITSSTSSRSYDAMSTSVQSMWIQSTDSSIFGRLCRFLCRFRWTTDKPRPEKLLHQNRCVGQA